MADRTCDRCDRPHYAHGVCVTHYRAGRRAAGIDAKRSRRAIDKTCEACGAIFTADRDDARYCDRTCRDIANLLAGQQAAAGVNAVEARRAATSCRIEVRSCLQCGCLFTARPGLGSPRMYCKPSHRASFKARHSTNAHRVHALSVHTRDEWICWLCGQPTTRRWTANDPYAPTLDHLIPRSLGGSDAPDNLGTAHAVCNSRRGARMITSLVLA
jgi:hypothetical protein